MGSLKSRSIEDYIPAKLAEIRADIELPFDVYLYFAGNSHVMLWKERGETPSAGFIDKYKIRGLEKIWIHRDDSGIFARYRNMGPGETLDTSAAGESSGIHSDGSVNVAALTEAEAEADRLLTDAIAESPEAAAMLSSQDEGTGDARTAEAETILEALNSIPVNRAEVSSKAQAMIAEAATAGSVEKQQEINRRNRQVIKDIMDDLSNEAQSLVAEIWKLADIDPELEHAVNVSTYAVIFAMAFGRIDKNLIADLALAGLLHDVGLSQVNASVVTVPWKSHNRRQHEEYAIHVQAGVELVKRFAPDIPERVKAILSQHHEKFDGTGYPKQLQGFKVDDISQLLSIADLLDSISSGQWDGTPRTLKETFDVVENLERVRTFPEHFNPDVFAVVIKWTQTAEADDSIQNAVSLVRDQTMKMVS